MYRAQNGFDGFNPFMTHNNPVNTKHLHNICTMLGQRRRRWADVVQMLYKCFVFTGKQRLVSKLYITENKFDDDIQIVTYQIMYTMKYYCFTILNRI